MYFLRLRCSPHQVDRISGELWEEGTLGVCEESPSDDVILLSAAFEDNPRRESLLRRFSTFAPSWDHVDDSDWVVKTRDAWPGRTVGQRLFLAAPWCTENTPGNRERIVHNPGLACGTGEHPCTQLALEALERSVTQGCRVLDIGTGSGILAIGALKLGAGMAVGIDIDAEPLAAARENFALNGLGGLLAAGASDCLKSASADLIVANINASVLLSLADDLFRVGRPQVTLILTGFPKEESLVVRKVFGSCSVTEREGWACLTCACEASL